MIDECCDKRTDICLALSTVLWHVTSWRVHPFWCWENSVICIKEAGYRGTFALISSFCETRCMPYRPSVWLLKWWRHKMIFLRLWVLFDCSEQTVWYKFTRIKMVLQCIKQLRYGFLKFKLLHTKLSYLVLVPKVRNRH